MRRYGLGNRPGQDGGRDYLVGGKGGLVWMKMKISYSRLVLLVLVPLLGVCAVRKVDRIVSRSFEP